MLLNETGLFDLLFDDAYVMDFVGALEYEPGAGQGGAGRGGAGRGLDLGGGKVGQVGTHVA